MFVFTCQSDLKIVILYNAAFDHGSHTASILFTLNSKINVSPGLTQNKKKSPISQP